MTLVISTPMKYHAAGEKAPQKHQLLLEFDDRTAVSCTIQKEPYLGGSIYYCAGCQSLGD